MSAIEALYIFDEHNNLLLDHTYTGRPPAPSTLLALYLQHPTPRPPLIYLPTLTPPTLCYSIQQDNILFLSPVTTTSTSTQPDPLALLEFLHRLNDTLQEFLGTPLLTSKLTTSYDIVAQILNEIADGGVVAQAEPNALRDVVETGPGVLRNLLGSLGAGGTSPTLGGGGATALSSMGSISSSGVGGGGGMRPSLSPAASNTTSAIPWRRSNVRHTSNELYVDIVESLSIILAPSGRALAAFAHGSIVFNCKVSGVPDLVLNLTTGGRGAGMGTRAEQLQRVMERVVFHPCVRLNKWKGEGVLSFVPPDGRFALAGYEVDLLGGEASLTTTASAGGKGAGLKSSEIGLPASLDVATNLGTNGAEFEVRIVSHLQSGRSAATASLQSHLGLSSGGAGGGRSKTGLSLSAADSTKSTAPPLEDITARVPLPASRIRNVSELRPSKGEAHWNPAEGVVEWKVGSKEFGAGAGTAVLRCTIQGHLTDEEENAAAASAMNGLTATTTYDYDDDYNDGENSTYQSPTNPTPTTTTTSANGTTTAPPVQRQQRLETKNKTKDLMPTSATLSFSLKGSLPSGLRVESLQVDTRKSRGLGAEIKPYKGVKYATVSREGVEVRC